MNYNRNFNPNVWDMPRPPHPVPPFANNQQNHFGNQNGNFHQQFSNFNQNFHPPQNHNQPRPLLGMPLSNPHPPPFRKNHNNNNPDYRRPGPACRTIGRNNNFNQNKWSKHNQRQDQRDDYNNRDSRGSYENNNNNIRQEFMGSGNNNNNHENSQSPHYGSLVEHLKAVQSAKKSSDGTQSVKEIDAICVKNASQASRKLLSQLKTMDKEEVKDLINNPKQPYKKKVLNIQAREKLREQMRKKLKKLGTEGDGSDFQLEPEECIDFDKIPDSLIAQIGKTMEINIEIDEDIDLPGSITEEIKEDKDIEVITKNLGSDFLMGSEMLLFNAFNLLGDTDTETDVKAMEGQIPLPCLPPPLPVEPVEKPPSPPPPEPIEPAALVSQEKPWSHIRPPLRPNVSNDEEWDIESAKNPDPPGIEELKPAQIIERPLSSISKHSVSDEKRKSPVKVENRDDLWDRPNVQERTPLEANNLVERPLERIDEPKPVEGQRANETYGEYRRRIAAMPRNDEPNTELMEAEKPLEKPLQLQQPPKHDARKDWLTNRDSNRSVSRGSNERFDNRKNSNYNRQQNNDTRKNWQPQQGRKSRFDTERERDQRVNNNNRNSSRDTNRSHESERQQENTSDLHNYRFQNQKPNIDRLTTLLNPKPLQFKGSFNKRTQNMNHGGSWRNSNSRRSQTPCNDSMERDFDESLLPSPNDLRPCYTTLKRVMDIDAKIANIHEKIHGIDKVIANLQSERLSHQKAFTSLQHDRKVLFDNLMKRAFSNADNEPSEPLVTPPTQKAQIEKKLQNFIDQKKRKHEEVSEEPKKKKLQVAEDMETTSAAAKAAKIQKEREEEERRQKLREKKRLKKLRKERLEADQKKLEEKIQREAVAATVTTTTVKQEPTDEVVEKKVNKKNQNDSGKSVKSSDKSKTLNLFKASELIQLDGLKITECSTKLSKINLPQNFVDSYISSGFVNVNVDDWKSWSKPVEEKKPESSTVKTKEAENDLIEIQTQDDRDPLELNDGAEEPATLESNQALNENSSEHHLEVDYSEWAGNFVDHDQPIVHLQNINGKFVIAASEDGKVFKYNLRDGKLASVFSKHKEICNSFLYDNHNHIYTVSSDGFLHKISFKSFQLVGSDFFNEPLQVIEKSKSDIYVGTKSGKIFRLKREGTEHEEDPICDLGALILCLRASKEGSRNILLVSSRTHAIQVRDATDGLLLRTLSDNLAGVSIYDMLIEGSTIYCGSNRHEIFAIDFTTGALKKSLPCGAGAICVKLHKNYLIAACYDGNIYIFDIKSENDAINICGPSNMLLAMDLWENKIIASTKDKTMKIMNIPT